MNQPKTLIHSQSNMKQGSLSLRVLLFFLAWGCLGIQFTVAQTKDSKNGDPQAASKVKFIGGARSSVANSNIQVFDSVPDNTTAKGNNSGYALMDLGIQITPNSKTSVLGMFRINNKFGGFWGAGVDFTVRQLTLKGILADKFRYSLGDINIKQTPFTLYNHNADQTLILPEVFQLQRKIVDYETFYQNNTWRQQGAQLEFEILYPKKSFGIGFMGYTTRLNATNFSSINDRLMSGASVLFPILKLEANNKVQNSSSSKFISNATIGIHQNTLFDVKGTSTSSIFYNNTIQSISLDINNFINSEQTFKYVFHSEVGHSSYRNSGDTASPELKDYFIHSKLDLYYKQINRLALHYMNVGPDFRSPGAQTKRIDYNLQPGIFNRYKQSQSDRPMNWLDFNNNYAIARISVNPKLMQYNPVVNNILPYGIATFNRSGIIVELEHLGEGSNKHSYGVKYYQLREIRGQGTPVLRYFKNLNASYNLELNSRIKSLNLGIDWQNTQRNSTRVYENVDLNTIQFNIGLDVELMKNIELLSGYSMLQAKGNEIIAERNPYSQVIDFQKFNTSLNQDMWAMGLKINFDWVTKSYFTILYQQSTYSDKLQAFNNYKIGQLLCIFNLTF